MKKALKLLVLLALCLLLCVSLIACGNSVNEKNDSIEISEDGYWIINGTKTSFKANSVSSYENPLGLAFYLKDDDTYAVSIGNATLLSKIEIPATFCGKPVTEIVRNGFSNSNLEEIIIPSSVTKIGTEAFYECDNLKSATIGSQSSYENLPIIDLSNSDEDIAVSIESHAFANCDILKNIIIRNTVKSVSSYAFYNCPILEFYAYKGACYLGSPSDPFNVLVINNGKYITSCSVHRGTKTIADDAFFNCQLLEEVTLPDSLIYIGESAFSGCHKLTDIDIPQSVKYIGRSAFRSTSIENISIPDNISTIYFWTLSDCFDLKSVTIPNSVTAIHGEALYNCKSLAEIHYNGTKAEWNAISKSDNWNSSTGKYIIYCTDGNLRK